MLASLLDENPKPLKLAAGMRFVGRMVAACGDVALATTHSPPVYIWRPGRSNRIKITSVYPAVSG
jgi:hypothetical protein